MKRRLERLRSVLTEEGTLSMQRRLFRMICLTSALLCAVILPINALQDLPLIINICVLLFGLFSLYLFRETFRNRDHTILYFAALLLVLNAVWFPNSGTKGSIIFYFAAALIYPMALTRGATRWVLVCLLVLDAGALMTVEYYVPSLVVPFASDTTRLIDLLTGIFCSSLAGVAALWVVITNYDWEHAAIARVSRDLAVSEKNYREVVESANAAVIRMDRSGTISFFNSFAETLFGFKRAKIIGMHIMTIFPSVAASGNDSASRIEGVLRDPSHPAQFESTNIRNDGSTVWLNWTIQPIYGETGELAEILCIGADITEGKALEEKRRQFDQELMQVAKLESLGILAGGIAHDFNNILAAILGNISLVRMKLDPASETHRLLGEAEKASLHARDLTAQLLTFSRGGLPVKRTIAIGSILRDALTISLRGSHVASEIQIAHDLWPVEADPGQLSQVFNNLIINACQAMPAGGKIAIEASNVHLGASDNTMLPGGRYVMIEVRDEGTGITEKHLSKIFDPYFTTKSGSGLGLAVTFSIIKNHQGHIAVRSKPGEGSTFTVYLPASDREPDIERKTAAATPSAGARILIVDDEEPVRNTIRAILDQYGYNVEFAVDGKEATDLYKRAFEERKPFDIVLLDLTIRGGMGGKETIRHLRDFDPRVRAVATSGYSNDPIMANFRDYGFLNVIAKPYQPSELNALLQSILADTTPTA